MYIMYWRCIFNNHNIVPVSASREYIIHVVVNYSLCDNDDNDKNRLNQMYS